MPLVKEESSQEPQPTFGPYPNTQVADFNLKKQVEHLPFKLNLGDIPLEKEHQVKFINLIYSNKGVNYCDQLTHTILTSTYKPVYLHHRTILRQLQGEVHECLNTCLCQGLLHPSNSPYGSLVVIVHTKSGENCLCVGYRKLNSITIRDAFPLPHIDKALQAVHSSNVFTSLTWHKDIFG